MPKLYVPFPKGEKGILRIRLDGNEVGNMELDGSEIDFDLHKLIKALITEELCGYDPDQQAYLFENTIIGSTIQMLDHKLMNENRIESQPILSKVTWELDRIFK